MTSGVAIGWRSASVDAIGAAVVLFGLVVALAAVVGGGFNAAGVTFPPLTGAQRGLIGMLGLVLIASGIALAWFDPGQEPSQLAGATLEDAAPRDAAETRKARAAGRLWCNLARDGSRKAAPAAGLTRSGP